MLVDADSGSASELLARTVPRAHRGTVIGDRTAGTVMVARHTTLVAGAGENVVPYEVSVTVADIVMPDGGRLELIGVEPDLKVLPSAEDLAAGRDPVLAQALALAGRTMDAAAVGTLLPKH